MARLGRGSAPNALRNRVRDRFEYAAAWLIIKPLGLLPRRVARATGRMIAWTVYLAHRRLRRTAERNLAIAFPQQKSADEEAHIIKGVFRNMGNLLGEVSQFPKLSREKIGRLVFYDGLENYERAAKKGRGVLFLTGHFGAWELCAFAHGAFGYKLNFLVRPLDNPLLERFVNAYRCRSGNSTIDKNNSVREVMKALKRQEAVGFLVDVNTLPDQGVFCDFFGVPACSSSGLAVFALRSGAPVVPGFLLWDPVAGQYRLRFEPEVELTRTGDFKEEVQINTAKFAKIIEDYARRYPDQWLWVHRRWKTRPPGEPDLYSGDHGKQIGDAGQAKLGAGATGIKAGTPH
ncbi:MAG: lysophospholipid acyltransferase family protein [Blastocatellia bacterium]